MNKNLFFFKNGEQESRTGPVWGNGTSWWGGYKETEMVKSYVLVYKNGKIRHVETISRMGGGGKGE
jgi:hypothetical protein